MSEQKRTALARTPGPWALKWAVFVLALSLYGSAGFAGQHSANTPARNDYSEVVEALKPFIEHQIFDKAIPALSIAIVDDQQIVWAQGFGMADAKAGVPATAETVYRIGSVSKLFTDIAIMQLVECGELNLDAPITDYLPDIRPHNPFGAPITLRELMSHRSGLLREPPIGNYFETTQPSLAATVRSLNDTELVFRRTYTRNIPTRRLQWLVTCWKCGATSRSLNFSGLPFWIEWAWHTAHSNQMPESLQISPKHKCGRTTVFSSKRQLFNLAWRPRAACIPR